VDDPVDVSVDTTVDVSVDVSEVVPDVVTLALIDEVTLVDAEVVALVVAVLVCVVILQLRKVPSTKLVSAKFKLSASDSHCAKLVSTTSRPAPSHATFPSVPGKLKCRWFASLTSKLIWSARAPQGATTDLMPRTFLSKRPLLSLLSAHCIDPSIPPPHTQHASLEVRPALAHSSWLVHWS
jgi:hypothetical protein